MQGFNKIIIAGNLTRDIELRYTPKGTAIAGAALALNRTWTSEAGEKKEEVTFVDFKVWGRGAEVISQYMKKGNPLLIEGRLTTETWDDKQTGQKRSKTVVVVETFTFIGGGQGSQQEGGERTGKPAYDRTKTANQNAKAQASDNDGGTGDPQPPDDSDDVPF